MLIPPERHHEEPEILARIRRGERVEQFETVRIRKDGSRIDISLTVSPVKDSEGRIIGASKIARDITERKRAQARQELLAREINHRTKNLFSVVHTIVNRSLADHRTLEEARSELQSRLHALSQTHTMLIDKEFNGVDLAQVVRAEMSPYQDRVTYEGPHIVLNAKAAQNFGLALHELATNAAKYGALSNATGRVEIHWSKGKAEGSDEFAFSWQERNGPPVVPPEHRGFGSAVLEQVMAEYFDPPPRVEFAPEGVRYKLHAPLSPILAQKLDEDE
jgi:two-component sensor histidine kinase